MVEEHDRVERIDEGKADMWALGCMLYALLFDALPFVAPEEVPEDEQDPISLGFIEDWVSVFLICNKDFPIFPALAINASTKFVAPVPGPFCPWADVPWKYEKLLGK